MEPEGSLPHSQASPACECFLTWMFYREGLLAPRPTPKLEDHPLLAVQDCLFNLFAATVHIGGRSSIRNLRTRHAVVTGAHYCYYEYLIEDQDIHQWGVMKRQTELNRVPHGSTKQRNTEAKSIRDPKYSSSLRHLSRLWKQMTKTWTLFGYLSWKEQATN